MNSNECVDHSCKSTSNLKAKKKYTQFFTFTTCICAYMNDIYIYIYGIDDAERKQKNERRNSKKFETKIKLQAATTTNNRHTFYTMKEGKKKNIEERSVSQSV